MSLANVPMNIQGLEDQRQAPTTEETSSLGKQACAYGTGKKKVDRQGPQGGTNTRGHRVRPWSLH